MAGMGAVIGPVALAWGLQRTSGTSASLMLSLEAVFTAVLAWRWYGEALDRRVLGAMLLLLAGAVVLVAEQGGAGTVQLLGLLAVLVATVAWGVDNTLSRGVAERDPGQVVWVKAALGAGRHGLAGGVVARTPARACLGDGAVGGRSHGLRLEPALLFAGPAGLRRRAHGGRCSPLPPFIGALGAFALGERAVTPTLLAGGGLMLAGVLLHLAESHGHVHSHEAMEHEHAHTPTTMGTMCIPTR